MQSKQYFGIQRGVFSRTLSEAKTRQKSQLPQTLDYQKISENQCCKTPENSPRKRQNAAFRQTDSGLLLVCLPLSAMQKAANSHAIYRLQQLNQHKSTPEATSKNRKKNNFHLWNQPRKRLNLCVVF